MLVSRAVSSLLKLALSLLCVLVVTAAPARAAVPCGPATARTVATGELTRVYVVRRAYVVCTRGHKLEKLWSQAPVTDRPAEIKVRGRYIGIVGLGWPYLLDARGLRLRVPDLGEFRSGASQEVRRWGLGPDGGMVVGSVYRWDSVPYPVRPERREIRRSAGCGREILDAGPDVDPDSLVVSGDIARWKHGADERSAPLCPSGRISRRVCTLGDHSGVIGLTRAGAMIETYRPKEEEYVRTDLCRGDRRTQIAETEDLTSNGSGVDALTSAGSWFAWSNESCWKECSGDTVTALNARTGKRRRLRRFFDQAQVAVNREGILAAGFYAYDTTTTFTVWTPRGPVVVADEDADPHTLSLSSDFLMWELDGKPRSARLP